MTVRDRCNSCDCRCLLICLALGVGGRIRCFAVPRAYPLQTIHHGAVSPHLLVAAFFCNHLINMLRLQQPRAARVLSGSSCRSATSAISKPPTRTLHHICRADRKGSTPIGTDDPNYAYSDPVNRFLGQFLPSNKAAKDELANRVDFSQPKLKGLGVQEMVGP